MQIVIDIPEGIYKILCKNSSTDIVRQAVIEGTPLEEHCDSCVFYHEESEDKDAT